MKSFSLFSLALLLTLHAALAQAQYHQWTALNESSDGEVQALFVKDRPYSNTDEVYVVGKFVGTVDFDPTAGTNAFTSLSSDISENYDTYIQKIDENGAVLWTRAIQMDEAQDALEITDVVVGDDGAIVLLGTLQGSVDVNPGAAVKTVSSVGGDPSLVVIKLNNGGAFYLEQNFAGAEPLALYMHASDIYIAGNFYGKVDFDYSADSAIVENAYGLCLLEITGTGTYLEHIYTGYNMQLFKGLDYDPLTNSFYVIGLLNNSTDFDFGTGTEIIGPTAGSVDFYVAQISRLTGEFERVKLIRMPERQPFSAQWNAVSSFDVAYGMLYLTGEFVDSLTVDPGNNQPFTSTGKSHYIACVALDDFEVQWVNTLASASYTDIKTVHVNYNELELYLMGVAAAGFDPSGNGSAVFSAQETFIARYNRSTGAYKGRKTYTGYLELTDIGSVDNTGNFYVCGSVTSTSTDLNPDGGVFTSTSGNWAGFVTAFGPPSVAVDPAVRDAATLAPNPARDHVRVQTESPVQEIRLLDATGKTLLVTAEAELNVAELPAGLYLVQIRTAQGTAVQRLVKE